MYDIGTFQGRAYLAAAACDAPARDAAGAGALYPVVPPRMGGAMPAGPGDATDMNGPDTAATPAVEALAYREAMSRLASAVHLVTTDGPGGRAGFTASAVCSVSDAPPMLLVCVNRSSSAYAALSSNDALCVSTLGAGHSELAAAFGGRTPPGERFALARWTQLVTGAPVLAEALVAFDCRIVARHPAGTHEVLFCAVQALSAPAEADALVYAGRGYHALPRQPRDETAVPRRAATVAA